MNIPTTLEALIIIVLIFIPGMILSQLLRSAVAFYPSEPNAWHFLSMGAIGLALHVPVFLAWTHFLVEWYREGTLPEQWVNATLWVLFAIFLWPIMVGEGTLRLVQREGVDAFLDRYGMAYKDRPPTAWDWAVNISETRWVKIRLKDGTWVAGWFGPSSFASIYKNNKDLYLERTWYLDANGDISDQEPNTDGIWIAHDQIQYMTFQHGQGN